MIMVRQRRPKASKNRAENLPEARASFNQQGLTDGRTSVDLKSGRVQIIFTLPDDQGLRVLEALRETSNSRPLLLWLDPAGAVNLAIGASNESEASCVIPVQAVKRAAPASPRPNMPCLKINDFIINPGRHEVLYKGRAVPKLTFTEFGILHFLASHPGWVFNRTQIVAGVRGENYPVTDRAVDVQVAGLRKKLGEAASWIETVRGVGYRFRE
ncbi:MAG: response regulator transcription factor [Kiritimatiellae bacterium]|nr:response regulator transcription factor [Kiritimatiellia bacterium]MDW8458418.1 response regulator transcription factor [Verrucomicrobiota bacterium]